MKWMVSIALVVLVAGCVSTQNDFDKGLKEWNSVIQSYGASETNPYPSNYAEQKLLVSDLESLKERYELKGSTESKSLVSWLSAYENGLMVQVLMRQSQEHLIASSKTVDCSSGTEFSKALGDWKQATANAKALNDELSAFDNNPKLALYAQSMESTNESQLGLLKENEVKLQQLCG